MAKPRHLVICENNLALVSSLLLRIGGKMSGPADIMFTDALDFSPAINYLTNQDCGLFDNVWRVETRSLVTSTIRKSRQERRRITLNPEAFMPIPFNRERYTDLWLNLDSLCPKYYYYCLVNRGDRPAVHFVEEGNSSYFMDLSTLKTDCIDHDHFKEGCFKDNCKDIWLSQTKLYQPDTVALEVRQLPKTAFDDSRLSAFMSAVFKKNDIPKQRYIFFEQCNIEDGYITNDLELVNEIASIVGRENMVIRLHPRTKEDRFKPLGYTTICNENSLWEADLMGAVDQIADKVLISIESTAVFTPLIMFDSPVRSVVLDKIVWGSYKNRYNKEKCAYIDALEQLSNKTTLRCFRPSTLDELRIYFDFLVRMNDGGSCK